jgi:hypothetical protein
VKRVLLALFAARAVSAAAALVAGLNPLRADSWVRWDSNLYLSIAQRGYFLEHCGPGSHYEPWQWCGNTGWFPLYAWLLKIAPGALWSLLFEAALLYVIWRWLLREQGFSALLLAALFPGSIYQQAVFPVSLFLFCAVAFLASQRPEPALLAAMAYPTGFLLVPVALVRRNFRAALAVCLGFFLVLVVLRAQTGHWDAYFLAQQKYGFHFAPLDTLLSRLKPLVNARYRTFASFAAGAQTLLVLAMMALCVPRFRTQPQIAAYCVAFWVFPLCVGGHLSLYRAEALLVPLVVLLPQRARLPLLAVAAPLSFAMALAFFRGALV